MSTTAAALTVGAILAVSLPAAYWQIQRARRHESTKARIVRENHERAEAARLSDPAAFAAPDPLRTEVEAHLTGYVLDNLWIADQFARFDRALHEGHDRRGEA